MNEQREVRYDRRSLRKWVERAASGKVGLADFQRSFVWTNDGMTDYIMAILEGKPVGLYLVLELDDDPQFECRPFHSLDIPENIVADELILDGQQRLTSLLKALYGCGDYRFFAKMDNLDQESGTELSIGAIELSKRNAPRELALSNPAVAYNSGIIPLHVLAGDSEHDISPLQKWCNGVWEDREATRSMRLERRIRTFFDRRFFDRELWCCFLPRSTTREEATEIFVNTNRSSVKVSAFDIQVAVARGKHGEKLRAEIRTAYDRPANVVWRHYFREDPEIWIPDIGEWLLKVACLNLGVPPRRSQYDSAVQRLLGNGGGLAELNATFDDLAWALKFAARLGGVTKRTLPSWPPIHVFAALRREYEQTTGAPKKDLILRLLKSYYWRCLFSDRYDADANRRLFDDYAKLKSGIAKIQDGGIPERPPAFDDQEHPLHSADDLYRDVGWIGHSSRLGRAIGSLSIATQQGRQALDWVTGEELTPERVRDLERDGNLERHHIFPKSRVLATKLKEKADSGLNGVFLDQETNRQFANELPDRYVERVVGAEELPICREEFRTRVESHLVPYREMVAKGDLKVRYEKFLRMRARVVCDQISKLAMFPEQN